MLYDDAVPGIQAPTSWQLACVGVYSENSAQQTAVCASQTGCRLWVVLHPNVSASLILQRRTMSWSHGLTCVMEADRNWALEVEVRAARGMASVESLTGWPADSGFSPDGICAGQHLDNCFEVGLGWILCENPCMKLHNVSTQFLNCLRLQNCVCLVEAAPACRDWWLARGHPEYLVWIRSSRGCKKLACGCILYIYVDILDYNWIILKRVLDRAARAIWTTNLGCQKIIKDPCHFNALFNDWHLSLQDFPPWTPPSDASRSVEGDPTEFVSRSVPKVVVIYPEIRLSEPANWAVVVTLRLWVSISAETLIQLSEFSLEGLLNIPWSQQWLTAGAIRPFTSQSLAGYIPSGFLSTTHLGDVQTHPNTSPYAPMTPWESRYDSRTPCLVMFNIFHLSL